MLTDPQITELINAGLLFLTVLGSSVTLHSGVFSIVVLFSEPDDEAASLAYAVDSGVAHGVLFGIPFACLAVVARSAGMDIG
jgi:hypothetical protein